MSRPTSASAVPARRGRTAENPLPSGPPPFPAVHDVTDRQTDRQISAGGMKWKKGSLLHSLALSSINRLPPSPLPAPSPRSLKARPSTPSKTRRRRRRIRICGRTDGRTDGHTDGRLESPQHPSPRPSTTNRARSSIGEKGAKLSRAELSELYLFVRTRTYEGDDHSL